METCTISLTIINKLRPSENLSALNSELDDLETWCQPGFYIANKIRVGVSFETYRLTGQEQEILMALEYLEKVLDTGKILFDLPMVVTNRCLM